MRTVEIVEAVLDADRLSEMTGADVRATRIRVKPGVSLAASLADRATAEITDWARFLWPASHVKADKTQRRADRLGLRIRCQELGGGILLQTGEIAADPALGPRLRETTTLTWPPGQGELLRYNPLRRVVIRDGDRVVRVSVADNPASRRIHRLLEATVSVPERVDDGSESGVSVLRFTGDTDLAHHRDLRATSTAGAELAALHTVEPGELTGLLAGHAPDPLAQAAVHADLFDHVAPQLASSLRHLTAHLPAPPTGAAVSHGDASPDQVLLDRASGRVWLTDFDRVCLAHPAADLGSYLAVSDEEAGEALLDGYCDAGGRLPTPRELRDAQVSSMLLRIAEPLRAADPHWRDEVAATIGTMRGMLP